MKKLLNKIHKKYRKALVTGGAGFIGSHLCEELLKAGIEVVSLDDYSAGKKKNHAHLDSNPNFVAIEEDIVSVNIDYISRSKVLSAIFENVDIIFHNAASKKSICIRDPTRDLEINAGGTLNILGLALALNVKKFVHASTGSVYGELQYRPQMENHPLNPNSYYGISKLCGENYVSLFNSQYELDTTVLRYFHVFGPRQENNQYGGVVAIFIRNLMRGQQPTIYGSGKQERSFTHVGDVVEANLLVAVDNRTYGEVYNCASGIAVSITALCGQVAHYLGKEVHPRYTKAVQGDIFYFDVSNDKLCKLGMDFETDFDKMLKLTIDTIKHTI